MNSQEHEQLGNYLVYSKSPIPILKSNIIEGRSKIYRVVNEDIFIKNYLLPYRRGEGSLKSPIPVSTQVWLYG